MKDKERHDDQIQYMPIGMCLGMSIGTAIGVATDNMSIWMCLGVAIGMCIGSLIDAKKRAEAKDATGNEAAN